MEIYFSGLSAGYRGGFVLGGLEGAVRPAALTALIGPNGSGKSTLLRVFAGLLPYSGSLALDGRELSGISRRELGRLVGVVPQQTGMSAPFALYDAVALGRLPCRGMAGGASREDDRLILRAAERTGLEPLLFRDVSRLSGGESQRVSLAAVLAQDPPLMLLDEPSSAQDPRHTAKMFSLLRELRSEGKTVVASVHDVNLAAAFADFFIAMKDGKILLSAPVRELDGEILEDVYGVPFEPYIASDGKRAWHVTLRRP